MNTNKENFEERFLDKWTYKIKKYINIIFIYFYFLLLIFVKTL